MKAARRLFLDASVLIAASGSRTGASSLAMALCRQGHYRAITSRRVLLESERNIRTKLGRAALLRFYEEIGSADLELVDPDPGEVGECAAITDPKDAYVLAGAACRSPS